MSLTLQIKFTPAVEAMEGRVREFPARAMRALVPVTDLQHELTIGHIQQTRLSQRGAETLGVRTGRLRGSIRKRGAEVVGNGLTVVSGLGSNVRYLGVHEFGFSGTVTVKAHERRTASFEDPDYWGDDRGRRRVSLRDAKQIARTKKGREGLKTGTSRVRAHERRMEVPARAPVRRGLEERLPAYREAMSAAIVKEWQRP